MKTWYLTEKTPTDNGNDLTSETAVRVVKNESTGEQTTVEYKIIKTVSDIDALRVRIDAALQVIKGELDDATQGVDYFGIILSNTPISMKVQELSRVIKSIDGVTGLTFDNAIMDKKAQTLSFYFTIYSAYGEFSYNTTFENIA